MKKFKRSKYEKDASIYLKDEQYLSVLRKILETISAKGFNPSCYDCVDIGNKSTESNCGFCNDEYTTLETSLFPEEFAKRGSGSMKYRVIGHKCPFDSRVGDVDYSCGCFYSCMLFNKNLRPIPQRKDIHDFIEYIRVITEKMIKEAEI